MMSLKANNILRALGFGCVLGTANFSYQDAYAAGKPVYPVVLSMDAADWNILYSIGMPPNPTQSSSANSWFIDIPDIRIGEVDYITQNVSGSIVGSKLMATITITTTGTPIFDYKTEAANTCVFPAHARFYIQKQWSNKDYVRWWSNPIAYKLEEGSGVLEVPLSPSQWSDTNGNVGNKNAISIKGFNSTLASPSQIGMTFGGGCFFGHGVRVDGGTARFTVTDFKIQ